MYKSKLSKILSSLKNLTYSGEVTEDIIYNSFFHLLFIKAIYKVESLQSIVNIADEWELFRNHIEAKNYFLSQLIPELIESSDKNIKFYFESSYRDLEKISNIILLNLYDIVDQIALENMSPIERYEVVENLLDSFSKLFSKNGAIISFRTPKILRDFLTLILNPKAKIDRIADLTCGTGSLLLSACVHAYNDFSTIKEHVLNGTDINRGMINIFIMHSYISGIYTINIKQKNILKDVDPWFDRYDRIYSDAPFGMKISLEEISPRLSISTRNADVLFLEATMMALEKNGLAAVIVSKSVLFSSSSGHFEIRKRLIIDMHLEAIISLPVRFENTSIPLVLIVFKNIRSDKPVLFIDIDKDVDVKKDINLVTKRLSLANELYHTYCDSGYDENIALDKLNNLCWFVDKKKIIDSEYILDISFYQPEIKTESLPISSILKSMEEHFIQMIAETKKIEKLSMIIEKIDKNAFKDYKLEEICEMRSGRPLPKEAILKAGELPWVQIRDITKSDEFVISSAEKSVSKEFANKYNLAVVEAGTILVSVRGTLGIIAIAGIRMCIGPNIVALNIINNHIDRWFLFGWFQKRKSIFQSNTQGVIPMLTISMLKNLTISIPTRYHQSIFADYSASLQKLQKLKQLSNKNNIKIDQVADSLFDNYFTPKA
jgi:type I restriction-modification system DNA methylase subunit